MLEDEEEDETAPSIVDPTRGTAELSAIVTECNMLGLLPAAGRVCIVEQVLLRLVAGGDPGKACIVEAVYPDEVVFVLDELPCPSPAWTRGGREMMEFRRCDSPNGKVGREDPDPPPVPKEPLPDLPEKEDEELKDPEPLVPAPAVTPRDVIDPTDPPARRCPRVGEAGVI